MHAFQSPADLSSQFAAGSMPNELSGFYRGKLITLFPKNPLESFLSFIARSWLPWNGKEFFSQTQQGCNQLPKYLLSFFTSFYGDSIILRIDKQSINVFPFQTKIAKGLQDNITVLRLTYDLPQNPIRVRNVVDELVCIKKDVYLGKAYLKAGNSYRLVAYFTLTR